MDYEIGYGRPPTGGRFKKGKSGNPMGRPKDSRNFMKLLEQQLEKPVVINENGRKKSISRLEALAMRLVTGALQGELRATKTLIDIMYRTGRLETPPEVPDLKRSSIEEFYSELAKELLDDVHEEQEKKRKLAESSLLPPADGPLA